MSNNFINPYNFIPIGTEIDSEGHKISKEEYYGNSSENNKFVSGWIDASVHIKTPLIISDGAHPERLQDGSTLYRFLKLPKDGVEYSYAIPGSALRGAIRFAYETVTDSCMPFLLNNGKRTSQRIPKYAALNKRGLLSFAGGRWTLYSATVVASEEVSITVDKKIDRQVYLVRADGRRVKEATGTYNSQYGGVMQYNFPVNRKEKYHIAYLKKKDVIKEWNNDEPYESLMCVLEREGVDRKTKAYNPNQKATEDLKRALRAEKEGKNDNLGVPVYYFCVEDKSIEGAKREVFISNSSIGRISGKRTWEDIVNKYRFCDGKGALCPACLLFGTKEGEGLRGRVRFTDAFPLSPTGVSVEERCLSYLGRPRPTAFEFYYNRPENAAYWNSDFYVTLGEDGRRIFHYLEEAGLRGRKMYWHSPVSIPALPNRTNSIREAISAGTFKFKIFFDEITQTQLDDLVWTITMGENNADGVFQYKLGHAKPLGYGSCKLTVDEICKREIRFDGTEVTLKVVNGQVKNTSLSYGTDNDVVKSFLKMANVDSTKGYRVKYPNGGYNWFVNNRKDGARVEELPPVLSDKLYLND